MSNAVLTETEFVRSVGKLEGSSEVSGFVRSVGAIPAITSY
jgi:hypothetical protein